VNELNLLMAAKLKGRARADAAAAYAGISPEDAESQIRQLVEAGFLTGDQQLRITPEGRTRIEELLTTERAAIDREQLAQAYEEFDSHNTMFKSVVTAWQMKDATTVNDHTDAAYDAGVIERLTAVHENFRPLLQRVIEIAPRLAPFAGRFDRAITAVQQGDQTYVARPMMDSYHTVWFELHEEMLGLLGLSRAAEAAAGRAV
jgi:pyruvate,orthophosphate dikinase